MDKVIKKISDRLYPKLSNYSSVEFASLCKYKKYIQETAIKDFSDRERACIERSEKNESIISKLTKAGRSLYNDSPTEETLFLISFAIAKILEDFEWDFDYYSQSNISWIANRVKSQAFDRAIVLNSYLDVIDSYCNYSKNYVCRTLPEDKDIVQNIQTWYNICLNSNYEELLVKIEESARNTVNSHHWEEFDVDGFSWAIAVFVYFSVCARLIAPDDFDAVFKVVFKSYVNKALDDVKYVATSCYPEDSNELFDLGYNYYKGIDCTKDLHKAVIYWEKAALKGHVMAQFNLAQCYESSIGVSQDLSKSFYWYQKAAENGDMDAIYNTGCNYYMGKGCKKDYYEAVRYFEMAADKQYTKAIYNLGICYRDGTGVQADYDKAVELLQQAANQGHEKAQTALQQMLSTYYKDYSLDWEDDDLAF